YLNALTPDKDHPHSLASIDLRLLCVDAVGERLYGRWILPCTAMCSGWFLKRAPDLKRRIPVAREIPASSNSRRAQRSLAMMAMRVGHALLRPARWEKSPNGLRAMNARGSIPDVEGV